jgi:hypothetical protein
LFDHPDDEEVTIMKNTNKLVALILALLLLAGAPAAFARTYVSDPVSPSISGSSSGDAKPEAEATPALEETPAPDATLMPETGAEPTPAPEAVITTEDENGTVNIRAAASTDAEIVGTLTGGMNVTVLGVEGSWTHIRADGIVGYVYSKYLNAPEPVEQTEAAPAVEQKINVTANRDPGNLKPGDVLTLSAELIGFEGVGYSLNWQVKRDGGDWEDVGGATGTTLTIDITESDNGGSWRLQAEINA